MLILFLILSHLQVVIRFVSRAHWQGDGHIELRVGNEKIGQTFGKILTTNNMCGRFDLSNEIVGNQINVSCNDTLFGRYLSIQKKAFGILEIDEVYYHPAPSTFMILISLSVIQSLHFIPNNFFITSLVSHINELY